MSFMGSTGYIIAGSGLETLRETVYVSNSIPHMMSGHAYARALSAHLLTSVALMGELVSDVSIFDGAEALQVKELLENYPNCPGGIDPQYVLSVMSENLHSCLQDVAKGNQTAKLWVQYLMMLGF